MLSLEVPMVECPRCGAWQEDHDGFGVLYCEKCSYCTHASASADERGVMVCGICGEDCPADSPTEPRSE